MKFGFVGNGAMSKAVQRVALERGHVIDMVVDKGEAWDFENSDIVCEVSVPGACVENVSRLLELKKDHIIITTGWYDDLEKVEKLVRSSGCRVMWSSNYSIGVNIYFKIIQAAAKLINKAEEYDIWATELHHKNKVDSPSGTAKILEEILLQNIDRKTKVVEERLQRKIKDDEIHFSSTRGGVVNFSHTVGFDSAADTIEIKHSARNRDGYALGAVKCAEWLKQQSPGFYSMEDYLKDVLEN